MDIFPILVVLSIFQYGQVYIGELFAYLFEVGTVSAVSSDENFSVGCFKNDAHKV